MFGDVEEDRESKEEEDSGFFPSESDPEFFDYFKSKGLHFLHLNAGSLLPKIEELRLVAQNSHAAVIGITEAWLDHSVTDHEIIIPNHTVIRKDRNREGGVEPTWHLTNVTISRTTNWKCYGLNCFSLILDLF